MKLKNKKGTIITVLMIGTAACVTVGVMQTAKNGVLKRNLSRVNCQFWGHTKDYCFDKYK